jgi:chondroitin 4-sulfotransferase 11
MERGEVVEEVHKINFPSAKKYKIATAYANYFRFAFVRNPWDRLVSCYKDKINYETAHVYNRYKNPFVSYLQQKGLYKRDMEFREFVEIVSQIPDEEAEGHIRSQYTYLEDRQGKILADFIGRFENLANDLQVIASRMGVRLTLPHLRRTTHGDYREYYDDFTIEAVRRRYAKDVLLFKYAFNG